MFENLKNKQFKIVEKFKWLGLISLVVILAGAIAIIAGNFNLGIDFTGGAKVEVELQGEVDEFKADFEKVFKEKIESQKFSVNGAMLESEHDSGTTYEFRLDFELDGKKVSNDKEEDAFRFALNGDDADASVNGLRGYMEDEVKAYFEAKGFADAYTDNCIRVYEVGASASESLIRSAVWAIIVAIIVVLIYIIVRFALSSGLAAVIALAHDTLIVVALTAVFGIAVNSTFIAAIITTIGYSINATIVIFDKVRECQKSTAFVGKSDTEIANYAIKHSMVKILLSTITTLIMVVALVIVKVSAIQEFILPIIFGLIGGTFSSLCLSPSIWVILRKAGAKINKRKKA